MATTNNKKLKLLTVNDEGKKSSQTFSDVNPSVTDENAIAALEILGGMQSDTVDGGQMITTDDLQMSV